MTRRLVHPDDPDSLLARKLFEETPTSNLAIAAIVGVSPSTLSTRRAAFGWKKRRTSPFWGDRVEPAPPPDAASRPVPPVPAAAPADAPLDRPEAVRLLAGRMLARLEAEETAGLPDPTGRRAGQLVLLFRILSRSDEAAPAPRTDAHDPPSAPPARSLAELRAELRRHAERLGARG